MTLKAVFSIFMIISLSSTTANASDKDEIFDLATKLSQCVGYYKFMSDFSKNNGSPASAEHLGNMARGAKTAASYSLSVQYAADNLDKKPKPFTDFYDFVDGRSDAVYTQLTANYEAEQIEPIQALNEECTNLATVQEEILNMIRKEVYLPKSN